MDTLFPYTTLFRSPNHRSRPSAVPGRAIPTWQSRRLWRRTRPTLQSAPPWRRSAAHRRRRPTTTRRRPAADRRDNRQGGTRVCRVRAGRRAPPPSIASRPRSEEHTSELQSLMHISYAVFCLITKKEYQRIINMYIIDSYNILKVADNSTDITSIAHSQPYTRNIVT